MLYVLTKVNINEYEKCESVIIANKPGLLQQYKFFLQTFEQFFAVHVIPLEQKKEDVSLKFPFYKMKTLVQ